MTPDSQNPDQPETMIIPEQPPVPKMQILISWENDVRTIPRIDINGVPVESCPLLLEKAAAIMRKQYLSI